MCVWIGVSKSGYYHWKNRPDSATEERRVKLKERIAVIFTASRETYGYRRVRAELARQAVTCGPELVRHLMRALDLRACQPRPWRTTTIADPDADPIADHMRRDFTASEPGVKLVGDITYIKTWEGFCYLSTVIDCHTKAVIGWAINDHMQTSLINESIAMAARNYNLRTGCVFHSDRGTQYQCHLVNLFALAGSRQDRRSTWRRTRSPGMRPIGLRGRVQEWSSQSIEIAHSYEICRIGALLGVSGVQPCRIGYIFASISL
jgi:hypothetical protein